MPYPAAEILTDLVFAVYPDAGGMTARTVKGANVVRGLVGSGRAGWPAVRALETRVGAALFIRTTRSVGLTEAGERFLSRAKPAFKELVAASEVARDLGQRPAGFLRLSVPRAVVPILLEPLIASFCQAYPEVEVEIAASEELVDLAAEGFDAGIRLGQFIAPDMIVVRLMPPFPFVVVGSPDYLRRRKRPERIDDLRQHPAHKGSFRLEYIWLGNQNLWRIRHTRPESPQLDSRAGGRKIILAHLCASFGGRRLHRS